MEIELRQVAAPGFGFVEQVAVVPVEEYERRLATLYRVAQADWVVVYADREHYANLVYLVNFDPRFEEALLLLGPQGRRVLVLGNEGMGYTSIVPVPIELALCQSFSLAGQQRDSAPRLRDVLAKIGIGPGQRLSVIGWKYLEADEVDDLTSPAFVPAFMVDVLRSLVQPGGQLVDGSYLLMHPQDGLRATNSADQIAAFEWAARNCSASVFSILRQARPGMSEMEVMSRMHYMGQPLTMHPILVSGKGALNGLRSPTSKKIAYGDAISTAVGYWGSLCCRAGLMLGEADASFFESVAAPYFSAIATWYQTVRIGITGAEVYRVIDQVFSKTPFHSALNPGHLTSFDEWVHSPMRPNSADRVLSGMVFQSDIIPTPLPPGQAMNCEDTVAIADAALRAEIRASYPEMWQRIQARRQLMAQALGFQMAEELLPLSDGAAYLPPFWLASELVCAVAS